MKTSKTDGVKYSDTVSSFLQKVKQEASSTPRMLTPSEQESLRLHAIETSAQARAIARKHSAKGRVDRGSISRDENTGRLVAKK